MCTLLILYRPNNKWPLIIAGNRDEMKDRPWLPPDIHWKNNLNIIAGKDLNAGGSWMGINKDGLVTTILNRANSLGQSKNKNSRGNIIIDVLKNKNIKSALNYIKLLDSSKFKPFNLFLANNKKAYWIKSTGEDKVIINTISKGKHFLDSYGLDSDDSERFLYNINKYKLLKNPDPDRSRWKEWIKFLSSKSHPKNKPLAALNLSDKYKKYGTLSSTIIALPSDYKKYKPLFLFNNTSPDKNKFYNIKTC